jgi:hypothetical protein
MHIMLGCGKGPTELVVRPLTPPFGHPSPQRGEGTHFAPAVLVAPLPAGVTAGGWGWLGD